MAVKELFVVLVHRTSLLNPHAKRETMVAGVFDSAIAADEVANEYSVVNAGTLSMYRVSTEVIPVEANVHMYPFAPKRFKPNAAIDLEGER